ncbi:MAG: hypothetical protein V1827_00425 [Candidatus Micrarchaeota archaeon]
MKRKRRILTPEQLKMHEERTRLIREEVRAYKEAVSSGGPASKALQLDVKKARWDLSAVRNRTEAEISGIASRRREDGVLPSDLDLRIWRIAVARALVDAEEKMLDGVLKARNNELTGLFLDVHLSVISLLCQDYFSKPEREINDGYEKMQGAFISLAQMTGIRFPGLEDAYRKQSTDIAISIGDRV